MQRVSGGAGEGAVDSGGAATPLHDPGCMREAGAVRLRTARPPQNPHATASSGFIINTTSTASGRAASVHGIGEAGAERGGRVCPSTSVEARLSACSMYYLLGR